MMVHDFSRAAGTRVERDVSDGFLEDDHIGKRGEDGMPVHLEANATMLVHAMQDTLADVDFFFQSSQIHRQIVSFSPSRPDA